MATEERRCVSRRRRWATTLTLALTVLSGCASTSAKPAQDKLSAETEARGAPDRARPGDAKKVTEAVRDILSRELRLDGAVQIALWNDRALWVVLEELGIAQADLVQAGLVPNPTVSFGYGFPLNGGDSGISLNVMTTLTGLITLGHRGSPTVRCALEGGP